MNVSNPETKGGARLSDLAAEMERATGILPSVASVALSVHTTMRVGGPADLYAQARDVAHL